MSDLSANQSPFAEAEYLAATLLFAEEELNRARTSGDEIKSAIVAAKKELRENTPHTIGNLWGSEAFEALAALNQYANPISDQITTFEENENRIVRLQNVLKSPYFARIDFIYEGEEEAELIYIGRTSLQDQKSHQMYIYDWRSPVASIFYRFVTGPACYDAPAGRIEGLLSFKRQYEIRNGVMEYYFDADVQIVDEFLRKLLSQNTSSRMKAIVETIQKEQDVVIRDMENDLMIVQGVAGSGKTSIALHRAAYLMYQGLSQRLLSHNILIVSPNLLFEQYISRVLPDLGEENVVSVVFEEIAAKMLRCKKVQARDQYLERLFGADHTQRMAYQTALSFKTSALFADIIDRFIKEVPKRFIQLSDIDYNGQSIMKKEQIRRKIKDSTIPLGIQLRQIEEHIMETVKDFHRVDQNHNELKRMKRKMQSSFSLLAKALYRLLFTDKYCLKNFMAEVPRGIINVTAENLNRNMLAYDDIAALLYLHLKLHGADEYQNIRQVVIDEAQDYYPLHYKAFKLLFRKAKYTILGDYNQTLEKEEDASLYRQIVKVLEKPKSFLVTMDKSFRSTNEIIDFSARFLSGEVEIKSFNRAGNEPQTHVALDEPALASMLATEAQRLLDMGYQSVGLICKTASNAKVLHHDMASQMEVELIKSGTDAELTGVFVIPVYLAKGLEFDAVLICDASTENYDREEDKKMLYVACTRALHHLGVYGVGKLSRWI